jgi:TPR repeat protein
MHHKITHSPKDEFDAKLFAIAETLYDKLLIAVRSDANIDVVTELLSLGAKINPDPETHTSTPLYLAVASGQLLMVKFLLSRGANINQPSRRNALTPLLASISFGHEDIFNYLLEEKTDFNLKNTLGCTPLHAAAGIAESNPELSTRFITSLLHLKSDHTQLYEGLNPLDYGTFRILRFQKESKEITWIHRMDHLVKNFRNIPMMPSDPIKLYTLGRDKEICPIEDRNIPIALHWYKKSATQGYHKAEIALMNLYEKDRSLLPDTLTMHRLYLKIAESKESSPSEMAKAEYTLGILHEHGIGVRKDEKIAFSYFEKANEKKFDDEELNAKLKYQLAEKYKRGKGTAKRPDRANRMYRDIAMRLNHLPSSMRVQANYRLGRIHEKGKNVVKDEKIAVEYYKKSAIESHASSLFRLGIMHLEGRGGLTKDSNFSIFYLKLASAAGAIDNKKILFQVALMFYLGDEIASDKAEAFACYKRAAEMGHLDAQSWMGRRYFFGHGGEVNNVEALKWFRKAAFQGDRSAQQAIDEIEFGSYMSPL